jgi:hypothetical protein
VTRDFFFAAPNNFAKRYMHATGARKFLDAMAGKPARRRKKFFRGGGGKISAR